MRSLKEEGLLGNDGRSLHPLCSVYLSFLIMFFLVTSRRRGSTLIVNVIESARGVLADFFFTERSVP